MHVIKIQVLTLIKKKLISNVSILYKVKSIDKSDFNRSVGRCQIKSYSHLIFKVRKILQFKSKDAADPGIVVLTFLKNKCTMSVQVSDPLTTITMNSKMKAEYPVP